jgi:hypothetical protein
MRINRDRIEKTWPRKKFIGVYPRPFNFFRFVFIRVHSWPEGFHDTALNEKSAGFRLFACMNRLPNWRLVGKAYFLTWRLAGLSINTIWHDQRGDHKDGGIAVIAVTRTLPGDLGSRASGHRLSLWYNSHIRCALASTSEKANV